MKVDVLPLSDIITISKMVRLRDEDEDTEDEGMTAASGIYALDSQGGIWKKNLTASELFEGFDFADPQLAKERVVARRKIKRKRAKA